MIGIGPAELLKGDQVAILKQSHVYFIVRSSLHRLSRRKKIVADPARVQVKLENDLIEVLPAWIYVRWYSGLYGQGGYHLGVNRY